MVMTAFASELDEEARLRAENARDAEAGRLATLVAYDEELAGLRACLSH